MNTFRSPLTPQEEEKYIKEYREGSAAARSILIEHNMRLVAHIVKKYSRPGREMDDLVSVGTIGLIKAVDNFEESKGRLATYAARCIDNEILMMLRSEKKKMREISLFEPVGTDKDGNDVTLIDKVEISEKEVYEKCELRQNVIKLYKIIDKVLNDMEKDIICSRYGLYGKDVLTQKQLAQKYDISRSYVSRLEKRAIEKLRKAMETPDEKIVTKIHTKNCE